MDINSICNMLSTTDKLPAFPKPIKHVHKDEDKYTTY